MRETENSGREVAGLIIILIGFALLMNTMHIFPTFPFLGLLHRFFGYRRFSSGSELCCCRVAGLRTGWARGCSSLCWDPSSSWALSIFGASDSGGGSARLF